MSSGVSARSPNPWPVAGLREQHLTRSAPSGLGWRCPATSLRRRSTAISSDAPRSSGSGAASARVGHRTSGTQAQLKHKGVTLQLLWIDRRPAHPDGYRYTQFCAQYRRGPRRSIQRYCRSTSPASASSCTCARWRHVSPRKKISRTWGTPRSNVACRSAGAGAQDL